MSSMTQAPLPSDLRADAPVLNDLERGVVSARDRSTRGETPHSPSTPAETLVGEKEVEGRKKHSGLTDGDEGESADGPLDNPLFDISSGAFFARRIGWCCGED